MFEGSGPRRVVPRWRASWVTAQTPEGRSNRQGIAPSLEAAVGRATAEFEAAPSVPLAAELMFVARQAEETELAEYAAAHILRFRGHISSRTLLKEAAEISGRRPAEHVIGETDVFLAHARRLLRRDFDNPVLLTDMAWAITAAGRARAAERYVRAALALAPNNRFVLRAAVRYFLHLGDKQRAHRLLLKSQLLQGDPWIQASEIAVASVLGKTSRLIKSSERMLEAAGVLPANLSELGSAVATVHLAEGDTKRAKRLFTRTLASPNDNVVAQAEWATRKLDLVVTESALKVKYSFEANSAHSYRNLDVGTAIQQAHYWREDEPFAARPIGWLAHLYAINDDFERAVEYHQQLLELKSDGDTGDLLNQNFSRIETGAFDEAARQLMQLSLRQDATEHRAQVLANAGALAYAAGDVFAGRELYERGAAAAKASGDLRTEALVRAFFARAAVKYHDPRSADIVQDAANLQTLSLNPSATFVMRRLVDEETKRKLELSAENRVARHRLEWDALNNVLRLK
jgi:tetratricopeptide (TPR) repeat protein